MFRLALMYSRISITVIRRGGTRGELDEALALLADEAGDVYSPDWPDRGSTNREEGPFPKWLGVGLLVLTVCLGISLIVHAIFQGVSTAKGLSSPAAHA